MLVSTADELSTSVVEQLTASHMMALIVFTILYYDYVLTFADEVKLIWLPQNRFSLVSVLFLTNRYLVLGGHVAMILYVFMFPVSESMCRSIYRFHQPFAGCVQFVILILCMLRVSAVYDNKRLVLWLLNSLIAVCTGTALFATISGLDSISGSYVLLGINGSTQFPGCNAEISEASSRRLSISWSTLLVFDFVVFLLTVFKALSVGIRYPIRLATVLLRDGSIYFIVIFSANLANVLMLIYAPSLLKNTNTIVTNILSSTLISRLVLNLRAEGRRQLGLATTDVNSVSTTIQFNHASNVPEENYELARA